MSKSQCTHHSQYCTVLTPVTFLFVTAKVTSCVRLRFLPAPLCWSGVRTLAGMVHHSLDWPANIAILIASRLNIG